MAKEGSTVSGLMDAFATATCGIVNPAVACRCEKQTARLVRLGVFDPEKLCWTTHPAKGRSATPKQVERALEGVERTLSLFRSHPDYTAPDDLTDGIVN